MTVHVNPAFACPTFEQEQALADLMREARLAKRALEQADAIAREAVSEYYVLRDRLVPSTSDLLVEFEKAVPVPQILTRPAPPSDFTKITIDFADGTSRVRDFTTGELATLTLNTVEKLEEHYRDAPDVLAEAKRELKRWWKSRSKFFDDAVPAEVRDAEEKKQPAVAARTKARERLEAAREALLNYETSSPTNEYHRLIALLESYGARLGRNGNVSNFGEICDESPKAAAKILGLMMRGCRAGIGHEALAASDAELVTLAAHYQELVEEFEALDQRTQAGIDRANDITAAMQPIIDRADSLTAVTVAGFRAKAVLADYWQPGEGSAEYDELAWMLQRSLMRDLLQQEAPAGLPALAIAAE